MSKVFQISEDAARVAYHTGTNEEKTLMERLFGADKFKGKLTDRIKTVKDACIELGEDYSNYEVPESGTAAEMAAIYEKRLFLLERVFNEGVCPDLADTDQYKYMPYFQIIPDKKAAGGFRLSSYGYGYVSTHSDLGARPEFLRRDDAIYVGQQFVKEYEAWTYYQRQLRKY